MNTIFPVNLIFIFDSDSELPLIFNKIQNFSKIEIQNFKNVLIMYFKPILNWDFFILNTQKLNSNKFLNHNYDLKNIYNLKNLKIKVKNNLPSLHLFLISKEKWRLKKNKYKIISHQTKDKQIRKYKNVECNQFSFNSSYYSISKNLCWENPAKKAHFVYYMTALPEKKDLMIYSYSSYLKKYDEERQELPLIGAKIVDSLLIKLSKSINLKLLERQVRINIFEINDGLSSTDTFKKLKLLRRLKLIRCFRFTQNHPEWMILSILPVLPPALRPIIQLDDTQIAISDLNKLYQKVIFRNNRIQKLNIGHYSNSSEEVQYAQRLLQESVDSLIENGKGGFIPSSGLNGRPLKSLSDILKGKKGRFRQNLLGKRVDYSGRSVIVVGPYLKVYECGIPKEMAIELFQPFIIQRLLFYKKARTILGAKKLIQQNKSIIYDIINEIFRNHPVLLNRAPTLHRLSIQSFKPILVEGRAIVLHPLVCSAFNADFDGDQMAVHIPLSYEARAEAWRLLWSQNNLLSPATGSPILTPTQDMVLGWYYLTSMDLKNFYIKLFEDINPKIQFKKIKEIFQIQKVKNFYRFKIFKKNDQILYFYNQNKILSHTPIWVYWIDHFEIDKKTNPTLELRFYTSGNLLTFSYQFQFLTNWFGFKISQFILTTPGRVLVNNLIKEK